MSDKVSRHVIPADLLRHGSGLMGPKVDKGDWVLFMHAKRAPHGGSTEIQAVHTIYA